MKNCKYCNKQFLPRVSFQKYCSERCKTLTKNEYERNKRLERNANKKPIVNNCIQCGKEFETNNKQKKLCSPKCSYQRHNQARKDKLKEKRERNRPAAINCAVCDTLFTPIQKRTIYCSKYCMNRSMIVNAAKKRCQEKGIPYTPPLSRKEHLAKIQSKSKLKQQQHERIGKWYTFEMPKRFKTIEDRATGNASGTFRTDGNWVY
jgi:hypothetical protein